MDTHDIKQLLLRDLDALDRELRAYPDAAAIWRPVPGIPNVGGTLALHLCGNLRHFVGTLLGGTGYVRDRDAEFSRRDVPVAALLAEVAATRVDVAATLDSLDDAALDATYPIEIAGKRLRTGLFLTHLTTHLAFHLGQADYHRRAVTGNPAGVGAVGIPKPEAA